MGLSVVLLGLRLSALQVMGLVLSLGGAAMIVLRGDPSQLLALQLNRGDLWILAAVLSWASYTVALKWRPDGVSALALLGATVMIGVVALLPFYLWELLVLERSFALVQGNLLTLAYVAVFPSVLAYFFWNYGVEQIGAAKAGLFINLMPLFGMGLSMLFLGEQPAWFHLVGLLLVLSGIVLAGRNRPA